MSVLSPFLSLPAHLTPPDLALALLHAVVGGEVDTDQTALVETSVASFVKLEVHCLTQLWLCRLRMMEIDGNTNNNISFFQFVFSQNLELTAQAGQAVMRRF